MGKTCCFIGQLSTPGTPWPHLRAEVIHHIEAFGVDSFLVGHLTAFDYMALESVKTARKRYPCIQLTIVLSESVKLDSTVLLEKRDTYIMPWGDWGLSLLDALCPVAKYMVERSQYVIGHIEKRVGIGYRPEYAFVKELLQGREISFTNLAEGGEPIWE